MEKKLMNKMEDMELDMVGGSASFPHHYRPRPRPGCHDSNANSMAAYPYAGQAETDHADCHP